MSEILPETPRDLDPFIERTRSDIRRNRRNLRSSIAVALLEAAVLGFVNVTGFAWWILTLAAFTFGVTLAKAYVLWRHHQDLADILRRSEELRAMFPRCLWCDEPVYGGGAARLTLSKVYESEDGTWRNETATRHTHDECDVRSILGSVGHQRGLCTCNGGPGTMDDPPGLTRREAAMEAYKEAILRGTL